MQSNIDQLHVLLFSYKHTNMTRIEKSIKNSGGQNLFVFLTPFVTADWFFGAAELRHRESSKR